MKKISTLFLKDPCDLSHVSTELDINNAWAFILGVPTRKFDGTACMIKDGQLYKRYDCKNGKIPPNGAIPCQDPDPTTGHWPHWVACNRNDANDKLHWEAYDNQKPLEDGTYELVGPKINRNKDGFERHCLVKHGSEIIDHNFYEYNDIKEFLGKTMIEGIVFHNPETGEMCKIRRKDFGFKW